MRLAPSGGLAAFESRPHAQGKRQWRGHRPRAWDPRRGQPRCRRPGQSLGRGEGGGCRRCWLGGWSCTLLGLGSGGPVPTPSAVRELGPGSGIFPPAPGQDFSSRTQLPKGNRRSFLGQVSKEVGAGEEKGGAKGKEKKNQPSWQVFRAQSRSGNASLPLIASRPDEFLEETAAETLHKSHCCACVGCLLKEVKGHRLWYIKKGKKIVF